MADFQGDAGPNKWTAPKHEQNYGIGGAGDDTLVGGDLLDFFEGGAGADHLSGDRGNDLLDGETGNDSLAGGSGNDTLSGGTGNDTLDGGSGANLADYSSSSGVTVDLRLTGQQNTKSAGHDTLINIQDLTGSHLNDTLVGSDGDNTFFASGGRDHVNGEGGFDTVSFVYIEQQLYQGLKINLSSSSMQSTYYGSIALTNIEALVGGSEPDTFTAASSGSHLDGGAGNDTLNGKGGADVLIGGDGSDYLNGGVGNDTIHGGAGSDWMDAGAGTDVLMGGDGDDTIHIDAGANVDTDVFKGGAGFDSIGMAAAADSANLTKALAAHDIESIYAPDWSLTLTRAELLNFQNVTAGSVHLTTGGIINLEGTKFFVETFYLSDAGNKIELANIFGDGDDPSFTVHGGAANDIIYGGSGNDNLDGGAGADTMDGNGGFDTFHIDSIRDVIVTSSNGAIVSSIDYQLTGPIHTLSFSDGAGHLGTGSSGDDSLNGGVGNDTLVGNGGDDRLSGGDGDDVLHGGSGLVSLFGGAGNDTLYAEGSMQFVDGGDGVDVLYSDVNVSSPNSVETIHLLGAATHAEASAGNTLIYGNVTHASTLIGGASNDTLIGGSGSDAINGGNGDDVMTGGFGANQFVFDHLSTTEVDEITDYGSSQRDVLDLSDLESQVVQAGVKQIDYIGTGAFTGVAGQAHIVLHDGYGLFEFDLNGDKVSDLTIKLDGITANSTILYQI